MRKCPKIEGRSRFPRAPRWTGWLAVFLCAMVARPAVTPHIEVVEGDGAINNIGLHRAKEPVVRVVDQDGHPVPNVAVTFVLPAQGPSGLFANGQTSITEMTGPNGQAVGRGLRPNSVAGQFPIHVSTSLEGQVATAALLQTNAQPVKTGSSSKLLLILALVGGAGAVGAAAALKGKSSGGTSNPPPSGATLTPGTPTLGAP